MGVDLRSNTMFARVSLVVLDDSLVKLEHARTEDRVRKFRFDCIERVIIWRKIPWGRITFCALLLVLPGALLQLFGEVFPIVTGIFLAVLGLGLILWYVLWRHTTIRIVRAGTTADIQGIFRPAKVRRLRDKLIAGIRAAQRAGQTAAVADAVLSFDGPASAASGPPGVAAD